jgi:hypothetical protein
MPTRRIFELMIVTVIFMHPALGLIRLWGAKTLGKQPEGSIGHGIAEIVTVIS